MPLISVFFCFTFNAGIGLYWSASSLFQVVLQIFINRHYRKMDMEDFVRKNLEKAEEKARKKREKKGVSASTLYNAANINTRNVDSTAANRNPDSIAARANLNVADAELKQAPPPADSLAAKAGLVQQYNEEHGDGPESTTSRKRKKYKK